jgi:phosphatidylinositol alpha-mannosyltransferase
LLRSADVFVAPHRDRESFGIVLLEALASGAPVVASDLPPFVDLLGHGRPGFDPVGDVFRVGDSQALARTVIEVLRRPNPERTRRAQQLARQYDWSRVGAAVLSVYRATLAAGPATDARAAQ